MKSLKRSLVLVILLQLPMSNAHAGIPTIDFANLIQWITNYMQKMVEWGERTNEINRDVQTYASYYNQVKGLQDALNNGQWMTVLNIVAPYVGDESLNQLVQVAYDTPTFKSQVEAIIDADIGHNPESYAALSQLIGNASSTIVNMKPHIERAEYKKDLYVDQVKKVSKEYEDSQDRRADLARMATKLRSLGNESDLETLQLLAAQQMVAAEQNEAMIKFLADSSTDSYRKDMMEASEEAERRRRVLDYYQQAQQQPFNYSTAYTQDTERQLWSW